MEWISASSTRNCLLANPLIDWLRLHGEAKGFVQDSAVEGYDPRLEFSRFVMDRVLGHLEPGVGGRYDRHDYLREKTSALAAWAGRLEEILIGKISAENVVELRPI